MAIASKFLKTLSIINKYFFTGILCAVGQRCIRSMANA